MLMMRVNTALIDGMGWLPGYQLFVSEFYIMQTSDVLLKYQLLFTFRTVQTIGDTGLTFDDDTTSCANGVCGRVLQVDQSATCTQAVGTTCDWTGLEINYDFSVKIKIYQCKQINYK